MIIELVGLPGSGKSFLCEELENDLKKNKNKVLNITKFSYKTTIGKILRKYFCFISNYQHNYNKHIKCINDIINTNIKNKYDINIRIDVYIERIAILLELYKKNKKIYLLDEGIIHYLIIMSIYFGLDNSILKELVKYVYNYISKDDFIVVYNKIEVEECIQSIKNRNRRDCAFDFFNDKDLKRFLKDYYDYCEDLDKMFAFKKVLRNDSFEKKKNIILK